MGGSGQREGREVGVRQDSDASRTLEGLIIVVDTGHCNVYACADEHINFLKDRRSKMKRAR